MIFDMCALNQIIHYIEELFGMLFRTNIKKVLISNKEKGKSPTSGRQHNMFSCYPLVDVDFFSSDLF